jgi:hypothetical protein
MVMAEYAAASAPSVSTGSQWTAIADKLFFAK